MMNEMPGFFYNLGRLVGPKIRKGKWVWNSLTASEDEILQAEYETGRDMAAAMAQELPPDRDPQAARWVEEIGTRLAGRLTNRKRKWAFHLVSADAPNAFAVPGGFIYVTRPLLELCEHNPDEIAFVLGHEIGHVVRGHSFDRLVSSTLFNVASRVTPVGRVLSPHMVGMGIKLMQSAYTQDQELEADSFGVRLTHSAGADPRAAIRMMERLQATCGQDALPEIFAYFASHPPFAVRMAAMRKHINA
ncbi:MAG TPA: M48 family metallopeptidase [Phycisphaerae bacterium]|nr:M48 family metallopeptidase [Phycisphaerae bacterium]HQE26210.1 M48 family metallopeptidase [Phycisphaerae bacterium]